MSVAMITAKDTQSFPAPGAPTFGGALPKQPSKALAQETGTEDKPFHHLQLGQSCPTKPSLSQQPTLSPSAPAVIEGAWRPWLLSFCPQGTGFHSKCDLN